MKRLFLFLFVSLIGLAPAFSQFEVDKLNATLGDEINVTKGKIVTIVGETNGKIYALANKKDKYFLNVFGSSKMNLISMKEIKMPSTAKKELNFERVELLDDKIYLIGSRYIKSKKTYVLNAFSISENGQVKQGAKRLFSVKTEKHSEKGQFFFKLSPDKKQIVVMHATIHSKKNQAHYQVRLFDKNLVRIASKNERVNFADRKNAELNIADFDVNIHGDLFVAVSESYYDKKKKKNFDNFVVFAYKKAKEYQKEIIKVDLSDNKVLNSSIMANSDNTLNLFGYYAPSKNNGKAKVGLKGVYAASIDLKDNKVININFNDFDYATKEQIIGKRKAAKDKALKPFYSIRNIIEKEDGGLLLLSESGMTIYGKTQNALVVAVTPVTYIRNEVIVTSLDRSGKTEWTRVIPKKQKASSQTLSVGLAMGAGASNGGVAMTVGASITIPLAQMGKGPEYLSFIPFYHNGELLVLFNDNAKNSGVTKVDDAKFMTRFNNSVPTVFKFDKAGNVKRIDTNGVDKNRLVVRPGVYHRKNPGHYIIYASRKSQNKLGRIILKGSQKGNATL
ncbi:hypothetical protein FUAX_02290 [Fulvitalea axinellae]|uniref:Uncharacterized protein n=1 Tax=Fulvitalea axinellae TaxID=1182444 RepID=A0AAU9CIW4_9BACT|nr:hypothetical protein FUAX_02290 [Fulvitalea axinellae]